MHICQQYIDALEEERGKIQVFSRELPLCLELVTQAIETYKQQLSGTTTEYNLNAQSDECSDDEHTSSDVPVLEEFIPLKRTFSHEEDEEEEYEDDGSESHKSKTYNNDNNNNNNTSNSTSSKDTKNKKSDWLRSVQLWNQTSDPTPKEELTHKKVSVVEVKKSGSGGAFHPFKKEKNAATAATELLVSHVIPAAAASSTAENGGGNKKEDKDGQRKQRRCWSPELHRRFLQALQQLGGSHVATPKQIRELMKVDGLTNDEVKSHLQKYRLHTRRPSPSSIHNNNQQPPQFVVVGGIWVPPPEYAAMAAAGPAASGEASGVANSNGIYAPIASLPKGPLHDHASGGTLKQLRQQKERDDGSNSHSDGGVHSNSPATSSSTHTTTASPAY